MKKIIFTIGLLVSGLLIGSCTDELDIDKKGNLGSVEDFYKTDEDATQAIAQCYFVWGSEIHDIQEMLDQLSDDFWTGGGGSTDYNEYQTMNSYTFGTDNSSVKNNFTALYKLIYNANLCIEKIDPQTTVQKQVVAEAYFFRGWAHFYLGACWGTAPVVDHLLAPSEYAKGNSTQAELYTQAENDFLAAINSGNLVTKANLNDQQMRITTEAAKAFLGKTYLFAGDAANAAKYLNEVVASQKYQLIDDTKYLLKIQQNFSSENVLERNRVNNTAFDLWDGNMYDYAGVSRGWRNDCLNWTNRTGEVLNEMQSGYGLANPRKSLYDAFKVYDAANGGSDYRLDNSIKPLSWLQANGLTIAKQNYGQEGYWNYKHRFLLNEMTENYGFGGWNIWVHINWRAMRYSEVLLLAAEANLTSNNALATADFNLVRSRAKLNTVGAVTLDMIKQEKRFELCFEGCRWLDLIRWGDAYTVLKDQGKQIIVLNVDGTTSVGGTHADGGFKQNKNELLPIPETEMLLNKNMVQNTGWVAAE